jgi:heme oxygenase
MSLKELTADKHREAENTPFMKAVFNRTLPKDLWIDWTYQKTLFYGAIEGAAGAHGLLMDLPDIQRAFYLWEDFYEMWDTKTPKPTFRPVVVEYYMYLRSISHEPDRVMAHFYTWHMGDLFGGQMIKKIVDASHNSLEFDDAQMLKEKIRSKINDSMGDEANIAFDWAIRMMRDYDSSLG